MHMKHLITLGATALVAAALTACKDSHNHDHDHAGHGHHHTPPHGGTAVALGKEEFHLELVLDATNATMQAYVMDGHLENYIRVTNATFNVVASTDGPPKTLTFQAVASTASGEKVGDTSLFEAKADWLKTTPKFDGVLEELTVRGKKFEKVTFNFPKGNHAH